MEYVVEYYHTGVTKGSQGPRSTLSIKIWHFCHSNLEVTVQKRRIVLCHNALTCVKKLHAFYS